MIDGLVRVNRLHHFLDGRRKGHRVAGSPNGQPHARIRVLRFRPIDFHTRGGLERPIANMADHAHHCHPGRLGPRSTLPEALADRVFVWPISVRQGLINHRDGRRALCVVFVEIPARDQGNAQSFKEARGDRSPIGFRRGLVHRNGARVHGDRPGLAVAAQRKNVDGACRLDAGQALDALHELAVKRADLLRLAVLLIGEGDSHG